MALPPFHIFGVWEQLLQLLDGTCVAVYTLTGATPGALPFTPSADNILEHARKTKCRSLVPVSVMLTESPLLLHTSRPWIGSCMFPSGPLPQCIGDDLVNQELRLISAYGATEFGTLSSLILYEDDQKEWDWFRVPPLVRVRRAPQGDETFECPWCAFSGSLEWHSDSR
ncbi:hypothetical protein DFH08DRAFT_699457 [Mycena albidolilacea]|uniref:AMP-dependent synthetase/ligase domain-containing protein n=1 Tax=Mycena albidolilacea TaxID=1033008 RepID=A0AAD7A0W7_9AGAR|nr:hypothetical protein DFH08DRAFT_699457 [Mycena albidolilacea]